jgi:uncharacterized membrane protein (UPF0136 family)
MNNTPTVQIIAAALTALYGVISIVGGYIGFTKGSNASLIAGGIAGVLLLLCAAGVFVKPGWSLGGALVISLALVGRFVGVLMQNREHIGAVLNEGKGITAYVMIVGGICVIAAAGLAIMAGEPQSSAGL